MTDERLTRIYTQTKRRKESEREQEQDGALQLKPVMSWIAACHSPEEKAVQSVCVCCHSWRALQELAEAQNIKREIQEPRKEGQGEKFNMERQEANVVYWGTDAGWRCIDCDEE